METYQKFENDEQLYLYVICLIQQDYLLQFDIDEVIMNNKLKKRKSIKSFLLSKNIPPVKIAKYTKKEKEY